MPRPKGLSLTAVLMALCNITWRIIINPNDPPYSFRTLIVYTVFVGIGFWVARKKLGKNRRPTLLGLEYSQSHNLKQNRTHSRPPNLSYPHVRSYESATWCGSAVLAEQTTSPRVLYAENSRAASGLERESVPRSGILSAMGAFTNRLYRIDVHRNYNSLQG